MLNIGKPTLNNKQLLYLIEGLCCEFDSYREDYRKTPEKYEVLLDTIYRMAHLASGCAKKGNHLDWEEESLKLFKELQGGFWINL